MSAAAPGPRGLPIRVIERPRPIADELFPEAGGDSRLFWEGLDRDEIRVPRCTNCGTHLWPNGPRCSRCGKPTDTWVALAPTATVFSWTRYHKPYLPTYDEVPYVVITAQFDAGVRMYGRLLDQTGDPTAGDVAIGDPVVAVIEQWANGRRTVAFHARPTTEVES